jgi:hypothetical protein
MDIVIHWGVYRYLREDVGAKGWILLSAIAFDVVVLGAFLIMKANSDPWIIFIAFAGIISITGFEKFYLARMRMEGSTSDGKTNGHADHHG